MTHFEEPPIDPLADTNPSIAVRDTGQSRWRRIAGWLSLVGAAIFTMATVFLLMTNPAAPVPDVPPVELTSTELGVTEAPIESDVSITNSQPTPLPTLNADTAALLLQTPIAPLQSNGTTLINHNSYDPFTIIPDRPRHEVTQYTAQQGDTIEIIADRFGLRPESIAWANNRRYVQVLYPGDVINILPVDGVYHQVVGGATIADIAAQYHVAPFAIIDSEFNAIEGTSPDTVLPSGTWLVIPGGQGEQIAWNPPVDIDASTGYVVSFGRGLAGSCGNVEPSGGTVWTNPLPTGTWVRGFTAYHSGLDLAAPTGTPVYAANSGPVIFAGSAGGNSYGNTVVLSHGPFTTLYGHLSQINVSCGQYINAGGIIGLVGSTGNSSGPHLHFEIRYGGEAQDPSGTPGLGW